MKREMLIYVSVMLIIDAILTKILWENAAYFPQRNYFIAAFFFLFLIIMTLVKVIFNWVEKTEEEYEAQFGPREEKSFFQLVQEILNETDEDDDYYENEAELKPQLKIYK